MEDGLTDVRADRARRMSIAVDGIHCDSFLLFDGGNRRTALRSCRISVLSAAYAEPRGGWILDAEERESLMDCLNERGGSPFSVWELVIIALNNENPTQPLDMFGTVRNKVGDLKFPDHLPIDLPMPDYRSLR